MWVSVASKLIPFQPALMRAPLSPRILFQPDIIRLSRRIGLRTIGSIGGKVPCPTAGEEQFTNRGFEEGVDLPGWTQSAGWMADTGYVTAPPTEGVYHACYPAVGYEPTPGVPDTLEQLFATPIPVACFKATSLFSVDTAKANNPWTLEDPLTWQVEVLYTDDTSTILDLLADADRTYVTHNLKDILTSGKKVKGVRVTVLIGNAVGVSVDNFMCKI